MHKSTTHATRTPRTLKPTTGVKQDWKGILSGTDKVIANRKSVWGEGGEKADIKNASQ